jgi:hypothetical protein
MIKFYCFYFFSLASPILSSCQKKDMNEYNIYSDVIDEYFKKYSTDTSNNLLVFNRAYKLQSFGLTKDINTLGYVMDHIDFKDGEQEVINLMIDLAINLDSFHKDNLKFDVSKIKTSFRVKAISDKKLNQIFKPKNDNWSVFYEKFPKSNGLIEVSEIVFDTEKRYCLFYLGNYIGTLNGYGCYLLIDLKAPKNKMIIKNFQVWVS